MIVTDSAAGVIFTECPDWRSHPGLEHVHSGEAVMANARVARLDASAQGFVVGLEFVE